MNLQKCKKLGLTIILAQFLEVSAAYSQESMEELNRSLDRSLAEKARIAAADQAASSFVNSYTQIMAEFERNSNNFQASRQLLEAGLRTRQDEIGKLGQYINEKLAIVTNPSSKPAEINAVWNGFLALRQQKNPCDDSRTLDSFTETVRLASLLHSQQLALSALPERYPLAPEHKPILDTARQGISQAEATAKQMEAIMGSYQGALAAPQVCNIFRNFDVIVALAAVAAEANQAAAEIDKIDINGFLAAIDAANAATRAVTSARRMLTSLDATLIRYIRAGYLNRSVAYADRYQDGMKVVSNFILNSPLVSAADKADISAKVKQVKADIEIELKTARLNETDGRRGLLLTRGRNLYTAAGKIFKDVSGVSSPDPAKKAIIDYCKANLGMSFPGRYLVPATKTIEEEAELDRKFETADAMIAALSGSKQ